MRVCLSKVYACWKGQRGALLRVCDLLCRCGHCQQLSPKWSQAARALKGIVKVAAVNCEEDKQLCSKHGWVSCWHATHCMFCTAAALCYRLPLLALQNYILVKLRAVQLHCVNKSMPFVKLTYSMPSGKVQQSAVCIGPALALGCSQACETLGIAVNGNTCFDW